MCDHESKNASLFHDAGHFGKDHIQIAEKMHDSGAYGVVNRFIGKRIRRNRHIVLREFRRKRLLSADLKHLA